VASEVTLENKGIEQSIARLHYTKRKKILKCRIKTSF